MHWQNIKHVTDSDSDSDGVSVRSEGGSVPNPPSANRPVRPELRPQSQPDPEVNQVRRRDRRKELQAEWNRAIKFARAAPLYIVTGSNAQDVPPGLEGFEYCEQHYVRAEGVPGPPDPSFLAICDCTTGCRSAQRCDCQLASELVNEAGERKYAYNSEEIFKFNLRPGVVVIECNEGCTCPQTCQNRVAQRPRDVPMEVFYTGDCGWGVRATTDLPVGKVLGVYTGKLIRREDADNLSDEHRSYIFDLDMLESGDEDASTVRYSVDSYQYGNWSRFINHSCEPNMKVYPVVWDTVAELNQPYLAFVTTKAVRARTELTIDYNPRDAVAHKQGKSKGKSRVPEGATRCKCGAEGCRGWVMV
ncbi:uncharacterized protein B0H18DRAFT_1024543 [Fomitopsis serialis]|uniref:uncharacterized protein n=1 Tax=Fomitopsis serialis TaxID=139415 RepID=UPI0020081B2E|nr:uncharacterized protein B0H18DRAFT_1024543 [Neoantrodia serialis]KAH9920278.1 hypothetical protein B0H18DRAFT_1024543 [Neoantrodia serialis]